MADTKNAVTEVPCCPELEPCAVCDTLDIRYRLPFRPAVRAANQGRVVPVEVTLHYRLTRCAGPLALGDIVYSTTLLPAEKVRLFTSDRHSRFSFDTESQLAYRQRTTSEESFYIAGVARAVSDLTIVQNVNKASSSSESSVSGGGGAGIDLGIIEIGGSVSGSSHDAQSASSLASFFSQHAQSSSSHVETGVRAASSVSIGEVATRTHKEGETEDHFESASRVFANPNRCHALTFTFYRLNKCQTVRFELVSIERRVDDPAAPTGGSLNPQPPSTGVSVIPSDVIATTPSRLDTTRRARESLVEEQALVAGVTTIGAAAFGPARLAQAAFFVAAEPIPVELRKAALAQVDAELVAEGLLDKSGEVTAATKARVNWERQISLPTPGVIVKGCLDDCDICEPSLDDQIGIELARARLENDLLAKQTDLLEKSQEYRCCPASAPESAPDA